MIIDVPNLPLYRKFDLSSSKVHYKFTINKTAYYLYVYEYRLLNPFSEEYSIWAYGVYHGRFNGPYTMENGEYKFKNPVADDYDSLESWLDSINFYISN